MAAGAAACVWAAAAAGAGAVIARRKSVTSDCRLTSRQISTTAHTTARALRRGFCDISSRIFVRPPRRSRKTGARFSALYFPAFFFAHRFFAAAAIFARASALMTLFLALAGLVVAAAGAEIA